MSARAVEAGKRSRRRQARALGAEDGPWRVSASGARFGLFNYRYLVHTKGRFAGQPLALEPWQLETMSELLQVERDAWTHLTEQDARQAIRRPDLFWPRVNAWYQQQEFAGLRVHREGLIGVPKKNGKSTKTSGLALYLLVGDDEPGAEVYSTASAKDQAKIVFGQAQAMVEASRALSAELRVYRNVIEVKKGPLRGSFYKVVAADAPRLEGINPHGVVNDEIHAQPNRTLYDTLRSATIAREQPLLVSITTAGISVKGTIGGELYERGAGSRPRYRDGQVVPRRDKQRSFYFRWYGVDWQHREDLAEIKKANPSSWITVAKLREEQAVPRPRGVFYRYHANIWTRVEEHWLNPDHWDACFAPDLVLREGDGIVVAIDAATMRDTTAISWARPSPHVGAPRHDDEGRPLPRVDDDDRIVLRAHIIGRHPDPRQPPPPAHQVIEDDRPLRLELAVAHVIRLAGFYSVLAVAADPARFLSELQELEDRGFETIRFDQTNANMVPASDMLYGAIGTARLAHNGDEHLRTHMENAVARDTGRGWRLDKRGTLEPMDAAVSSATCVFLAEDEEVASQRRPSLSLV